MAYSNSSSTNTALNLIYKHNAAPLERRKNQKRRSRARRIGNRVSKTETAIARAAPTWRRSDLVCAPAPDSGWTAWCATARPECWLRRNRAPNPRCPSSAARPNATRAPCAGACETIMPTVRLHSPRPQIRRSLPEAYIWNSEFYDLRRD